MPDRTKPLNSGPVEKQAEPLERQVTNAKSACVDRRRVRLGIMATATAAVATSLFSHDTMPDRNEWLMLGGLTLAGAYCGHQESRARRQLAETMKAVAAALRKDASAQDYRVAGQALRLSAQMVVPEAPGLRREGSRLAASGVDSETCDQAAEWLDDAADALDTKKARLALPWAVIQA